MIRNAMKISEFASEMADREAIRDCLYRFTRGVDRLDTELLQSSVWPEFHDDHRPYYHVNSDKDLVEEVVKIINSREFARHAVVNSMIRIDGNTAYVESYFLSMSRGTDENGRFESQTAGRYIDRMERRNDEWRIIERNIVRDWFGRFPATDNGESAHKPHDKSYKFLPF